MQQEHLFYNEETNHHAVWTMADAVDAGMPIDAEDGDDLDYVGPVVHKTEDHVVAVDSNNAMYILDISTGTIRSVLIDEKMKWTNQPERN